jgi:hypothetical protein
MQKGAPIVLAAGTAAVGLAALCLALAGTGEDGTAVGLRATALLAFPFLATAYVASSVVVLWPGDLSDWLLRNRRSLALAFAAVFGVHLALIAHLLRLPPDPPATVLGLIPGAFTYAVVAAMVLASVGGVARAVGTDRAALFLRIGQHWVFAFFTLALLKGVFVRHYYAWWLLPLLVAGAVYAVRFGAWRRTNGTGGSIPAR